MNVKNRLFIPELNESTVMIVLDKFNMNVKRREIVDFVVAGIILLTDEKNFTTFTKLYNSRIHIGTIEATMDIFGHKKPIFCLKK